MPPASILPSDDPARRFAVIAESLYLANLLIAPGFAFLGLLWLWRRPDVQALPLARQHLRQTLAGSLWAGALLLGLSAIILAAGALLLGLSAIILAAGALVGDSASMWSWFAVILYFIVFHSALVLCGMLGLSRALAGQPFRFPLIGPG